MKNLKQNNLAESTTEIGFVKAINENAGETIVALQKEVTLDTGETVVVEGITPNKMKTILNNPVTGEEEEITFKTPGEKYNEEIKGVCQIYNNNIIPASLVSIAITKEPDDTEYLEGETFDTTGMEVTATYSDGSKSLVTEYTYTPVGELQVTDTKVTITYQTKTAEQLITVVGENPEEDKESEN